MRIAIFLGLLLGTSGQPVQSAIRHFSLCLVTVPEMFVLIDSVQFTFFCFLSGEIGTVWYFPLYASRVLMPMG